MTVLELSIKNQIIGHWGVIKDVFFAMSAISILFKPRSKLKDYNPITWENLDRRLLKCISFLNTQLVYDTNDEWFNKLTDSFVNIQAIICRKRNVHISPNYIYIGTGFTKVN